MFQLYKKRGFSDYLNDTFSFLKLSGRHFLKNYFIISGGFFLVFAVLGLVMYSAFSDLFIASSAGDSSAIENFFANNIFIIIPVFFILFFILIVFGLITYLYPIVYMRLYEEHQHFHFSTSAIGQAIRSHFGRTIKFSILSLLLWIVLGVFVIALFALLCITIIGIPFAFIGFLALSAISYVAFYIYVLDRSVGVIDSYKIAFDHVKNNLWPIVGANFAMLMLVGSISAIFYLIPYVFSMIKMVTNIENGSTGGEESLWLMAVMGIGYFISMVVRLILQNLVFILNGLIYFSMLDANNSVHSKNEIDLIGNEEEF